MDELTINLHRKLVSNARAIISNQISITLGVQVMNNILWRLKNRKNSYVIPNIDFGVFRNYYYSISLYAIGKDRLQYNIEYLIQQDKDLDKITASFKEEILRKCFEIIDKLRNYDNIKRKIQPRL